MNAAAVMIELVGDSIAGGRLLQQRSDAFIGRRKRTREVAENAHMRLRVRLVKHSTGSMLVDHDAAVDIARCDSAPRLRRQRRGWIAHHMHGGAKGGADLWSPQRGQSRLFAGRSGTRCCGLLRRQLEQRWLRRIQQHPIRLRWLQRISHSRIAGNSRNDALCSIRTLG